MNQEETNYVNALQEAMKAEELRRMQTENRLSEQSMSNIEKPNIIEYQLDLQEELDRIQHILSGHVIEHNKDGGSFWAEPKDDRLKILSDYGVKQIMSILYNYLSKNILLSNFDEDTIKWKVKDFAVELTDLIFSRYEYFFSYPSPEELFEKYKGEANSLGINEYDLYLKCIQWSKEELQSKFRHFPMIIQMIVDTVHATYLRALNGEERESLRKQYNIHQSLSNNTNPLMSQGKQNINLLKPSTWK